MLPKKVQHYQILRNRDKDRLIVYYHLCVHVRHQISSFCGVNRIRCSIQLKEGRFSFAFLTQNLHIFLVLVGYFRSFTEIVLFKYLRCFNISYIFFHVNHEEVMNIDRTNTAFKVFLHYLQYALEVLRVYAMKF